jgi:glycosyltransferase involved in cell wall biosynthesis
LQIRRDRIEKDNNAQSATKRHSLALEAVQGLVPRTTRDAPVSTPPEKVEPKVSILMCCYNGERYLSDQIQSFKDQTYRNLDLWVSDDGSHDKTLLTIKQSLSTWQDCIHTIRTGPSEGFAANFMSLITCQEIDSDYYTYSDQDDIWEADKIQRGVSLLEKIPSSIPALYCSRTVVVNAENVQLGLSTLFTKDPSFQNALVQNIGGANTMLLNRAARDLIMNVSKNINNVTSHDWWSYLIVIGCGGKVIYDSHPSIRYRQHQTNLVGSNLTLSSRIKRARGLICGEFRRLIDLNVKNIQEIKGYLTAESRESLDLFTKSRDKKGLIPRLIGLKQSGIHRQNLLGNLGLIVAAIFKKI